MIYYRDPYCQILEINITKQIIELIVESSVKTVLTRDNHKYTLTLTDARNQSNLKRTGDVRTFDGNILRLYTLLWLLHSTVQLNEVHVRNFY